MLVVTGWACYIDNVQKDTIPTTTIFALCIILSHWEIIVRMRANNTIVCMKSKIWGYHIRIWRNLNSGSLACSVFKQACKMTQCQRQPMLSVSPFQVGRRFGDASQGQEREGREGEPVLCCEPSRCAHKLSFLVRFLVCFCRLCQPIPSGPVDTPPSINTTHWWLNTSVHSLGYLMMTNRKSTQALDRQSCGACPAYTRIASFLLCFCVLSLHCERDEGIVRWCTVKNEHR